ncbi:50S ribosomal protein L25 [Patescibacteria group bacterium]|nr:MAG: 50S ribosomal protein L25 [Patescibacteria group bacterium]
MSSTATTDKIVLTATTREQRGKSVNQLRQQGQTPAVIYGHGSDTQSITINTRDLSRAYARAGGNQIIGVKIDDARQKNALFHDVQIDAPSGRILHADFYLVKMDEKIKTEIPLHMIGESTAVYQQEGSLVRPLESIEVEALPGDLPESIEYDISVLDDFDKSITVADLKIPAGVEVLTAPEELVAKVEPPRSDEELEELDAEIDEQAEMPEGAVEEGEEEVVTEDDEPTRKEPEGKAGGAESTPPGEGAKNS